MGDKGAKLLASGAASLPSVSFLSLRANRLTHVGTCALLTSLRPFALMTLDLSNNNIGEEGARMLGHVVLVSARTTHAQWGLKTLHVTHHLPCACVIAA